MQSVNLEQELKGYVRDKLTKDSSELLKEGCIEIEFLSGSTYIGEGTDSNKNGNGIYKFSNGDIYFGEWQGNLFHGSGTYIFANGESFRGRFVKG